MALGIWLNPPPDCNSLIPGPEGPCLASGVHLEAWNPRGWSQLGRTGVHGMWPVSVPGVQAEEEMALTNTS